MGWPSWSAFWDMGGYGLYVWAAYLVALVIAVAEILVLVLSRRSILEHLGLARPRRGRIRPAGGGRRGKRGSSAGPAGSRSQ